MTATDEGAIAFEALLSVYRKSRDGIVVSFVVHPSEVPRELALAPIGQRFGVALAMLGDDKPSENSKSTADEMMKKARTRAVLLCEDTRFHAWITRKGDAVVASREAAADWLRGWIGADSRSSIASSTDVYQRFLTIEAQYRKETGLVTERR